MNKLDVSPQHIRECMPETIVLDELFRVRAPQDLDDHKLIQAELQRIMHFGTDNESILAAVLSGVIFRLEELNARQPD